MMAFSEACERNKGPILEVLRRAFAERRTVLEIGSGTGQHAQHFAAHLPHLTWLPSERSANIDSLRSRLRLEAAPNLLAAQLLDVTQAIWPADHLDAVFSANTLHIMSWLEVTALFSGLERSLSRGGVACIYGPFRYHGRHTALSNERFDAQLRAGDANCGIRDLAQVEPLALSHGLRLVADHDLPANNRLLQFARAG